MNNIKQKQLAKILARNWWMLLLRGFVAILFGILTWVMPRVSLEFLVLLFGAFVLLDGVFGAGIAIAGWKEYEDWWVLLLWGFVGVGIGILTFAAPVVTGLVLLFFIAVWAIATGVLEIVVAIRLRREVENEWLLILGGLVSILLGIFLMMSPGAGALALIWLIGIYAVAFGIVLVMLASKLRNFGKQLDVEPHS